MLSDEEQYILDTDASETSIGDILSQLQNGEENAISNASFTYNKPEWYYCTMRQEFLAVINFFRQFE